MSGPRCIAEHETMTAGVLRRCARRVWGETPYCYQHAISNGHAVVVSPFMLAVAVARVVGTDLARTAGPAIWHELEKKS